MTKRMSRLRALPRLMATATKGLLAAKSVVIRRAPVPIKIHGTTVGRIERIEWRHGSVILVGRCLSKDVPAGFDTVSARPLSSDAFQASGPFQCQLERPDKTQALRLFHKQKNSLTPIATIQPPSMPLIAWSCLLALPRCLLHICKHWRDIHRYVVAHSPEHSIVVRNIFGLGPDDASVPLATTDMFTTAHNTPTSDEGVVVIVPIHNAASSFEKLLRQLTLNEEPNIQFLLVDDASTDPKSIALAKTFAKQNPDRSTLIRNPTNLGFVASINIGLKRAKDLGHHVVILNSDTLPPRTWVHRLVEPIRNNPKVASVTPFSNTAEIVSVPAQRVQTDLTVSQVQQIDTAANRLTGSYRTMEIPTGIGFAMAMNRNFIDQIGGFDPAFGRGYGEEVDWCQRASASGGRHVLAANLFVGHEGGASFPSEEKHRRLRASAALLRQRFPKYENNVHQWSQARPHLRQHIYLSLAWLAAVSSDPVPIFLGHQLGGGAEIALQQSIKASLAKGTPGIVVLRVGGISDWSVDLAGHGFRHRCRANDIETVCHLLQPLRTRRVIYSCGVGARDALQIPELLVALCTDPATKLDLQLHDYFMISPSYCLLNGEGQFIGARHHNCRSTLQAPFAFPQDAWHRAWHPAIKRADSVTAFSPSSAKLFRSAYPTASRKLRLRPHAFCTNHIDPLTTGGQTLGILGGINQAKGADVLVSLARHWARNHPKRRMVVIGQLDPNYQLPRPHKVTGRYNPTDISRLARRHDIGAWIIPSVWPETFSFTTREALATGLPVLTFDLGAQAEAAGAAQNGHVLKCQPSDIATLSDAIEQAFGTVQTAISSRPAA